MFEEMTYENILNDMLSRVSSDVDKREGSIIYDALAPAAYKLAEMYFKLNNFLDLVFADTAVDEYLNRRAAEQGVKRNEATYAIRKIEASGPVDVGTRWGLNGTTYIITEEIAANTYKAQCEQVGTIGNQYSGELDTIDNISGVTANLTDIITSGQEEESNDILRKEFFVKVQTPRTSGNIYDYLAWALEVPGVGDAKVYPTWNGPGTVKVLVVNTALEVDGTLEHVVFDHIESVRPIGAGVTVSSPSELAISVSANVVLDGSKSLSEVESLFAVGYSAYLKSTVFNTYAISHARVGSILLNTPGIEDYTDLLLNGGTANIPIDEDEIPVAGTITLTEVV